MGSTPILSAKDLETLGDDYLLKPAEVAAIFRVDPKTVTRWAKGDKDKGVEPRLSSIRTIGGHRRFKAGVVRRRLEDGTSEAETNW